MTRISSLTLGRSWIRKNRKDRLPAMLQAMQPGSGALRMAIDCSLDKLRPMSDKEVSKLANQLMDAHSLNWKSLQPCHLHLTGLETNGRIDKAFQKYITNYDTMMLTRTDQPHDVYFNREDLVYLSPDSEYELHAVSAEQVYVLGGLVDSTVDKYVTERYASSHGVRTAKLPIQKYMEIAKHTPHHVCLPFNLVLGILLSVYTDGDWTKSLDTFIPKRKGFSIIRNIDNTQII